MIYISSCGSFLAAGSCKLSAFHFELLACLRFTDRIRKTCVTLSERKTIERSAREDREENIFLPAEIVHCACAFHDSTRLAHDPSDHMTVQCKQKTAYGKLIGLCLRVRKFKEFLRMMAAAETIE